MIKTPKYFTNDEKMTLFVTKSGHLKVQDALHVFLDILRNAMTLDSTYRSKQLNYFFFYM